MDKKINYDNLKVYHDNLIKNKAVNIPQDFNAFKSAFDKNGAETMYNAISEAGNITPMPLEQLYVANPTPQEETSFWDDFFTTAKIGLRDVGANMLSTINELGKYNRGIQKEGGIIIAPDENFEEAQAQRQADYDRINRDYVFPRFDKTDAEMQEILQRRYQNKDFWELAKEGRYADAIGDLALQGVRSAPNTGYLAAMSVLPGGAALGMATTVVGTRNRTRRSLDTDPAAANMTGEQRDLYSFGVGFLEGATEQIGNVPLMKFITKRFGKHVADDVIQEAVKRTMAQTAKNYGKAVFLDPSVEFVEEMSNSVGQQVLGILLERDEEFNIGDAIKQGVYGTAGGFYSSPIAVGAQYREHSKEDKFIADYEAQMQDISRNGTITTASDVDGKEYIILDETATTYTVIDNEGKKAISKGEVDNVESINVRDRAKSLYEAQQAIQEKPILDNAIVEYQGAKHSVVSPKPDENGDILIDIDGQITPVKPNEVTVVDEQPAPITEEGAVDYNSIDDATTYAQQVNKEFGTEASNVVQAELQKANDELQKIKENKTIDNMESLQAVEGKIAMLTEAQSMLPTINEPQATEQAPQETEPQQAIQYPVKKDGSPDYKAFTPTNTFEYTKAQDGEQVAIQDAKDEVSAINSKISDVDTKIKKASANDRLQLREQKRQLQAQLEEWQAFVPVTPIENPNAVIQTPEEKQAIETQQQLERESIQGTPDVTTDNVQGDLFTPAEQLELTEAINESNNSAIVGDSSTPSGTEQQGSDNQVGSGEQQTTSEEPTDSAGGTANDSEVNEPKINYDVQGTQIEITPISLQDTQSENNDTSAQSDNIQQEGDLAQRRHLRKLQEGEFAHIERVFNESNSFSFTSGERIETYEDVAFIFKQLENAAIENSFAVLVKDGKPTVVHLGMGGLRSTIISNATVIAAVNKINPDDIYIVHNHPSGALIASDADRNMLQGLKDVFKDKLKDGIIINLASGKFATFNTWGGSNVLDNKNIEDASSIKLYSFNEQVFNKDYDYNTTTISAPEQIASFISSQRLGDRDKISFLILNGRNQIVGNIHVAENVLTDESVDKITKQIIDDTILFGGASAVIYGNNLSNEGYLLREMQGAVQGKSKGEVHLLDAIDIQNPDRYISANEQGMLREPQFQVDQQPTTLTESEELAYDATRIMLDNAGIEVEVVEGAPSEDVQMQTESPIVTEAKSNGTYLKAPNGADTNLTPQQWEQVRTPEFKEWFGDWENDPQNASKVVDENGEPLVVYHGGKSGIKEFDEYKTADGLFWFSENKQKIESGESGAAKVENIYPTFLLIKSIAGWNEYDTLTIGQIINKGYDGLQLDDDFVAFYPTQIKSATSNVGTFDANNPDIRYLQTPQGVVYGYTTGGKIYLTKAGLNPNTPIHEYTHIWDKAVQKNNPELWNRGVELMKQTSLWEQVKNDPNYANIANDDNLVASEVHARLTGEQGAEILTQMSKEALNEVGVVNKAKALDVVNKLKAWVNEFWTWVKDTMTPWTKEEAEAVTLEEFINMPIGDLAKGTNLNTANAKNKKSDKDYGEPLVINIGKKRMAEYERLLSKKRPDLTAVEKKEFLDYMQTLGDTKKENLTFKWFADGVVRVPEDQPKIDRAIEEATKNKVDPMSFKSPMDLINTFDKHKTFDIVNPDDYSELSNKSDYGDGLIIYEVDDDREGQQAMNEIMKSHFGVKNGSPWCLLEMDNDGDLTDNSWKYWKKYNSIPKRVAFKDGRLIAFSANDEREVIWWDKQDTSHSGIPVTKKMPNDELGRTADYLYEETVNNIGGRIDKEDFEYEHREEYELSLDELNEEAGLLGEEVLDNAGISGLGIFIERGDSEYYFARGYLDTSDLYDNALEYAEETMEDYTDEDGDLDTDALDSLVDDYLASFDEELNSKINSFIEDKQQELDEELNELYLRNSNIPTDISAGSYSSTPTNIHKGNKQNGKYEEWKNNDTKKIEYTYKDGKLLKAIRFDNDGSIQDINIYLGKDSSENAKTTVIFRGHIPSEILINKEEDTLDRDFGISFDERGIVESVQNETDLYYRQFTDLTKYNKETLSAINSVSDLLEEAGVDVQNLKDINGLSEPTQYMFAGQNSARTTDDYKKGKSTFQKMPLTIELEKGDERKGTDKAGNDWSVTLNNPYGYIKRTKGKDGEEIDVFLGDNSESPNVYVIDQVKEDGTFDEHKVMLGFDNEQDAAAAYLSNYEQGWQGLGNITEVKISEFKKWKDRPTAKRIPFAEYKSVAFNDALFAKKIETKRLDKKAINTFFDNMHILKEYQDYLYEKGVDVPFNFRPYDNATLIAGRDMQESILFQENQLKNLGEKLAVLSAKGIELSDIDNYLAYDDNADFTQEERVLKTIDIYMIAKHASERNAYIFDKNGKENGSGMTDEQANAIVAEFESNFDQAEISEFWDAVKQTTDFALVTQFQGDLISQTKLNELRDMFTYYVPLRGWDEMYSDGTDYSILGFGSVSSTKTNLKKKASGRTTIAASPLATMANMGYTAIFEKNRNRFRRTVFNMVTRNPDRTELFTKKRMYYKYIGTDTDGNAQYVEVMEEPTKEQLDSGEYFKTADGIDVVGKSTTEQSKHNVDVYVNGTKYTIQFKYNKGILAAQAINNVDKNDAHKFFKFLAKGTRFMSANSTMRNPEFFTTNTVRDASFAMLSLGIQGKKAIALMPYMFKAYGAIHRNITKQEAKTPEAQQMTDAYNEFLLQGGSTGYSITKDFDEIVNDLQKEIGYALGKKKKIGLVNNLMVKGLMFGLQYVGTMAENSIRFAAYMEAIDRGAKPAEAALEGKEITVNFNRRGTIGQELNSWSSFANAILQGTYKGAVLSKRYPKAMATALGSLMAVGFGTAMLSALLGGEDENGEPNYYNISEFTRNNNMLIPIGDGKFIKIPMPPFFRVAYGTGAMAYDVIAGRKDGLDLAGDIGLNAVNELSPLNFRVEDIDKGFGNSLVSLSPTVAKPFFEAYLSNQDFLGRDITRTPYDDKMILQLPQYQQANSLTNEYLIQLSANLNALMGGDENISARLKQQDDGGIERSYFGGLSDINPSSVEHVLKSYLGGLYGLGDNVVKTIGAVTDEDRELDSRTIPFVRRFYEDTSGRSSSWRIYLTEQEKIRDFVYYRDAREKLMMQYVGTSQSDKKTQDYVSTEFSKESIWAGEFIAKHEAIQAVSDLMFMTPPGMGEDKDVRSMGDIDEISSEIAKGLVLSQKTLKELRDKLVSDLAKDIIRHNEQGQD